MGRERRRSCAGRRPLWGCLSAEKAGRCARLVWRQAANIFRGLASSPVQVPPGLAGAFCAMHGANPYRGIGAPRGAQDGRSGAVYLRDRARRPLYQ